MEAGTIAPADLLLLRAQATEARPAMEAGTIAPADASTLVSDSESWISCNGGRDYCPG